MICLRKITDFFSALIDTISYFVILFVLVVLPLYNHWDYSHIGSEKVALLWAAARLFAVSVPVIGSIYILLRILLWKRGISWKWSKIRDAVRKTFSITDMFVACYGVAVVVSYLFSDYQKQALMGRSSWGMGALIQFAFVLGYFCISHGWEPGKWIFYLAIPTTVILFVLGYFNRFGIYPIPMKLSENPAFISLVGNINWYCGYMVMPIFAAMCYVWGMGAADQCGSDRHCLYKNLFWYGYLFLCFAALITNGSNSGILTMFGISLLLFFLAAPKAEMLLAYCKVLFPFAGACLFTYVIRVLFPDAFDYPHEPLLDLFTYSFFPIIMLIVIGLIYGQTLHWQKKDAYPQIHMKRIRWVILACIAVLLLLFIGLVTLNTIKPGSIGALSSVPVFTFSDRWGSSRGATWKTGIWIWTELTPWKKLIGIGSDCMDMHIRIGASEAIRDYVTGIWSDRALTNAHCEPLTVLIHNGLFGLIAFGGLVFTAVYRYLRQLKPGNPTSCLIAACGVAIAAYAMHNLVSFQQVMNGPTMFVILGIGEAFYRRMRGDKENK